MLETNLYPGTPLIEEQQPPSSSNLPSPSSDRDSELQGLSHVMRMQPQYDLPQSPIHWKRYGGSQLTCGSGLKDPSRRHDMRRILCIINCKFTHAHLDLVRICVCGNERLLETMDELHCQWKWAVWSVRYWSGHKVEVLPLRLSKSCTGLSPMVSCLISSSQPYKDHVWSRQALALMWDRGLIW